MTKDARLEMRVSAEEKELLRVKAKESGQSVSDLLRQGVGLGREPEPVKERPAKASVEEARPVGSAPTPSADVPLGFKRLVAQIQGRENVSQERAEETARKRLGMDS